LQATLSVASSVTTLEAANGKNLSITAGSQNTISILSQNNQITALDVNKMEGVNNYILSTSTTGENFIGGITSFSGGAVNFIYPTVSMPYLPTTSTGLASGTLWNSSGIVHIV
jgi:hypothetical protein